MPHEYADNRTSTPTPCLVEVHHPELIRYVLDSVTRAARTETDLSLDAEGIRDAGGWLLEARP